MGWLTNPKKAAYNRIYNRTTFDIFKLTKTRRRGTQKKTTGVNSSSVAIISAGLILLWIFSWMFH